MDKKAYQAEYKMKAYPAWLKILWLSLFPCVGILLIAAVLYVLFTEIEFAFLVIPLASGPAIYCMLLGWVEISSDLARYSFEVDGLKVKYPLRAEQVIPWNDFQQVCVCYAYYVKGDRGHRAEPVICCVKKGEKKNSCGHWKTDNPFRYKSVITILYSDELYEGIKERCPYEVPDLRETLVYRCDWY